MVKVGGPGSRLYEAERSNKYDAKAPACFSKKQTSTPAKHCAHCQKHIPKLSNYFQDIPNIGDLCNPCHAKWYKRKEEDNA